MNHCQLVNEALLAISIPISNGGDVISNVEIYSRIV